MRWGRSAKSQGPDDDVVAAAISKNVAVARGLADTDRLHLVDLTRRLISSKRWEGIGGIELNDEVLVTIAANAAIPILAVGVEAYQGVHAILIHPTTRHSTGLRAGPAGGVFSDESMAIVGEASPNRGPVSISWDSALAESRRPQMGRNVVIHEFAHKIDMLDGYSDGIPPMAGEELDEWNALLRDEYGRVEPDPSDVVLRPYAWSNPAEFFAVCTEAFFCIPVALRQAKPHIYEALAVFYRVDPGGWG